MHSGSPIFYRIGGLDFLFKMVDNPYRRGFCRRDGGGGGWGWGVG